MHRRAQRWRQKSHPPFRLRHGWQDRLDDVSDAVVAREAELYKDDPLGSQLCDFCQVRFDGEAIAWMPVWAEKLKCYCSWYCFHAARDAGA